MTSEARERRTRSQWQAVVEQWEKTDLPASEFAEQVACSWATLYYWKKKFATNGGAHKFIEVNTTETEVSEIGKTSRQKEVLSVLYEGKQLTFTELPPVDYLRFLLRGA